MIVYETCKLLWDTLCRELMQYPTEERWLQIAQDFEDRWNFPNCVGALDGKHCILEKPPKSGSLYFSYKKQFSVVLLGMVDANYRFVCVDIGSRGGASDSGVFSDATFGEMILNGDMKFPDEPPYHLDQCFLCFPD